MQNRCRLQFKLIFFFQNNTEVQESNEKVREVATKEEIPPECLIKHPLQNQWTLWYLEMDRNKSWEDMQNEITSFDTVEDFWSLYNHIRSASELKGGNDYSLFKKHIRPMWEDDANKRGGRWVITLNKQQRRNELDILWLDVVSALIVISSKIILVWPTFNSIHKYQLQCHKARFHKQFFSRREQIIIYLLCNVLNFT